MNDYEEIQRHTLCEYMSLFERPTIVNLAKDSKIQKTRLFRLINGVDMRLSEYLVLKQRIRALNMVENSLEELAVECEQHLNSYEISELSKQMSRRVRQKKLQKITKEYSTAA